MRRITMWLLATLSSVVLLFSYRTSTSGALDAQTISSVAAPAATATASMQGSDVAAATTADAASGSQTYTGSAVSTRYGPVQVQITVTDGKVTDATVTEVPSSNGRDQQINAAAVPTLEKETITAQSADIDMVSGATFTSTGYVQSLQSAIDQAHLG